jgi:hypothetical protein
LFLCSSPTHAQGLKKVPFPFSPIGINSLPWFVAKEARIVESMESTSILSSLAHPPCYFSRRCRARPISPAPAGPPSFQRIAGQLVLIAIAQPKSRRGVAMKADVEKTIEARVAAAFEDILAETKSDARGEILKGARDMVKTVWIAKIYAALPKDKTTIPEYFLDAELEQFLNEAIEECYARICTIAERAKKLS